MPILKLTTVPGFSIDSASKTQREILIKLRKESKINGFKVSLNKQYLGALKLSQNSLL